MKLSRKGLNKIHCSYVRECSPDLNQVEFEQSDFEGVVVLTHKEAELLMDIMREAQQLEVRPDGETVAKLDGLVNLIAEKVEKTK